MNRLPQGVAALYREAVDPGERDHFRELSGLLFGAKERYRSARATISYTVDGAVAEESNRRFVDWRFAQGNPGMGIVGKPGRPEPEDFYREYEDAERVVTLWHERPDRWREERRTVQGSLLGCVVAAGRHGPLWMYELTEEAIHVPSVPERRDPDPLLAFMLDPSEEVLPLVARRRDHPQDGSEDLRGGSGGVGGEGRDRLVGLPANVLPELLRPRRHHRPPALGRRTGRDDTSGGGEARRA